MASPFPVSWLERLEVEKGRGQENDQWVMQLGRLKGEVCDDGVERIASQRVFDYLKVPLAKRKQWAFRRLAKVMIGLGWSSQATMHVVVGGYRQRVTGFCRDAKGKLPSSIRRSNRENPTDRTPYPAEFRAKILERIMAGEHAGDLAREYKVHRLSIYHWIQRAKDDAGVGAVGRAQPVPVLKKVRALPAVKRAPPSAETLEKIRAGLKKAGAVALANRRAKTRAELVAALAPKAAEGPGETPADRPAHDDLGTRQA